MKRLLMTAIVGFAVVSAWAQGTVLFANYLTGTTPPILAITYDGDGITPLDGADGWVAGLYYGFPGTPPEYWVMAGTPQAYRTGPAAGRLPGVSVSLPMIGGGQPAVVQLRAWNLADGATWEAASVVIGADVSGLNAPSVLVVTGNNAAIPPTVPAFMIDVNTGLPLTSSRLYGPISPEPSTILIGLAGLGGLVFLRRKLS